MTRIGLVTGGGSGIGRATARLLASRDHHVVVADLNLDNAERVVHEIRDAGYEATAMQVDVRDDMAIAALFEEITARFGRLDSAVNNAGITGPIGPVHEFDPGAAQDIIDIDLIAVFACLQQELRIMTAQGAGRVVNLGSIWGLTAGANYAAYTAAKHGVLGMTRAAALETAEQGIRVNAICPGFTLTPMLTDQGLKLTPGTPAFEAAGAVHPMGRMAEPEEIAASICWLLGDESSFVTGHALSVDGGFVVR